MFGYRGWGGVTGNRGYRVPEGIPGKKGVRVPGEGLKSSDWVPGEGDLVRVVTLEGVLGKRGFQVPGRG